MASGFCHCTARAAADAASHPDLWPFSALRLAAHLALHALVEAGHVDHDALVRAVADHLALVAGFHAERDGAALDGRDLSRRRDVRPTGVAAKWRTSRWMPRL